MPKYYCEYCDIYLTHSSPGGRRQHNAGRKHINNKIDYFASLLRDANFLPPAHVLELGIALGPMGGMQMMPRPAILGSGGPAIIRPPPMAQRPWGPPMMMVRGMPPMGAPMPPMMIPPGPPGMLPPRPGFRGGRF